MMKGGNQVKPQAEPGASVAVALRLDAESLDAADEREA